MNLNKYLNKIILGDTFTVLKTFPNEIVAIGVTSLPYNKGEDKKGWLVTADLKLFRDDKRKRVGFI